MNANFRQRLQRAWDRTGSLVCVGLDPDLKRIPAELRADPQPILAFNRRVVDATAHVAAAYKPQFAHYAAVGAEAELEATIDYIRAKAPDAVVILDAKRGDIGSTAEMYAREAFDRYQADCVTVNPYLGGDGILPFVNRAAFGAIVLCRTSNASAGQLQDVDVAGEPLYLAVARRAAAEWNPHQNLLLVVGATYPEELRMIRSAVPDIPFLVPGIGEQGGDLAGVLAGGLAADGNGLLISSSRGIIFAGGGEAGAIRAAAEDLNRQINALRKSA
ncbi:MAG: orotidine-5'-phosphate decarboxylase [Chromatiales bacterium]|jgi:orotidine-5'-phosphate decarboxylase|nr:orotidine-5'-phosphate decarboxylase [Chromatiales bacterium]